MLLAFGLLLSSATLPPRSDILSTMESVIDFYLENKVCTFLFMFVGVFL